MQHPALRAEPEPEPASKLTTSEDTEPAKQEPVPELEPELESEPEAAPEPELMPPPVPVLDLKQTQVANSEPGVESVPQNKPLISRAWQRLAVICPEGSSAGDVLRVQTPEGTEVDVAVPKGVNAGDEFELPPSEPTTPLGPLEVSSSEWTSMLDTSIGTKPGVADAADVADVTDGVDTAGAPTASNADSFDTVSAAGQLPGVDDLGAADAGASVKADTKTTQATDISPQTAWMQETVAELETMLSRREAELVRREAALDQRKIALERREKAASQANEQQRARHAKESAALAARVAAVETRELVLRDAEEALQVRQHAVGEIASLHEQLHYQQRAAVTASGSGYGPMSSAEPEPEREPAESQGLPTLGIEDAAATQQQPGMEAIDESTMADVIGSIMTLELGLQSPGSVYMEPSTLQQQQQQQQLEEARSNNKAKTQAAWSAQKAEAAEVVRHRSCTLGLAENGFEANPVPADPNGHSNTVSPSSPAWKRIQAKRERERRAMEEQAASATDHQPPKEQRKKELRVGKSWRSSGSSGSGSQSPAAALSPDQLAAVARQERIRKYEREAILETLRKAMRARRTIFGHPVESPRDLFEAVDRNHSGTISVAELDSALKRLGAGLAEVQVERLAAFIGVDDAGEIQYRKIVTLLSEAKAKAATSSPRNPAMAAVATELSVEDLM
eukprot:COSAG06_NODE_8526_length_2140_cov_1.362077_1_plen_680_part_00